MILASPVPKNPKLFKKNVNSFVAVWNDQLSLLFGQDLLQKSGCECLSSTNPVCGNKKGPRKHVRDI